MASEVNSSSVTISCHGVLLYPDRAEQLWPEAPGVVSPNKRVLPIIWSLRYLYSAGKLTNSPDSPGRHSLVYSHCLPVGQPRGLSSFHFSKRHAGGICELVSGLTPFLQVEINSPVQAHCPALHSVSFPPANVSPQKEGQRLKC